MGCHDLSFGCQRIITFRGSPRRYARQQEYLRDRLRDLRDRFSRLQFIPHAHLFDPVPAFQAIGAAMLYANSSAILTKAFPAEQRGQALGLQGAMTYLGLTTGPFLGGWLSDTFGWHSVFYINVPIGLIAIWLSLTVIPRDVPSDKREQFDLSGAFTFLVGLVTLLFALNQGHNWGWSSPIILGLFIASFLTLSLFVWIERHVPAPMLDLSLFKRRVFTISTISPIMNYICIYSILFLTPFYFIQARGLSASQAGLILTAQPIIMALTAPLSGTLSDRVGSRLPTTLGLFIFGGGLFLLSRLTLTSHYGFAVIGLAICGLGTGLFVAPNNSALMGDAPRNRQGIASGVLALGSQCWHGARHRLDRRHLYHHPRAWKSKRLIHARTCLQYQPDLHQRSCGAGRGHILWAWK